jgi:diamine N-acetyltransferase
MITAAGNRTIIVSKLLPGDTDKLVMYLQNLSTATKKRFGPHAFDKQAVVDFYNEPLHCGYIAYDTETNMIIAYAIIKIGYLSHDAGRLQSYGLNLKNKTDCTFAPSVADSCQGLGIGNNLFHFILADLKTTGINRIILWGGVQADNNKAVYYYRRNGFTTLGQFFHNGNNYDMVYDIV